MEYELNLHWEVLGEAVQTILRKEGELQAYEKLKDMTRGEKIDAESIRIEFKPEEALVTI